MTDHLLHFMPILSGWPLSTPSTALVSLYFCPSICAIWDLIKLILTVVIVVGGHCVIGG
jgi:hypothetical protein